jgi:hypothetical protein
MSWAHFCLLNFVGLRQISQNKAAPAEQVRIPPSAGPAEQNVSNLNGKGARRIEMNFLLVDGGRLNGIRINWMRADAADELSTAWLILVVGRGRWRPIIDLLMLPSTALPLAIQSPSVVLSAHWQSLVVSLKTHTVQEMEGKEKICKILRLAAGKCNCSSPSSFA